VVVKFKAEVNRRGSLFVFTFGPLFAVQADLN